MDLLLQCLSHPRSDQIVVSTRWYWYWYPQIVPIRSDQIDISPRPLRAPGTRRPTLYAAGVIGVRTLFFELARAALPANGERATYEVCVLEPRAGHVLTARFARSHPQPPINDTEHMTLVLHMYLSGIRMFVRMQPPTEMPQRLSMTSQEA